MRGGPRGPGRLGIETSAQRVCDYRPVRRHVRRTTNERPRDRSAVAVDSWTAAEGNAHRIICNERAVAYRVHRACLSRAISVFKRWVEGENDPDPGTCTDEIARRSRWTCGRPRSATRIGSSATSERPPTGSTALASRGRSQLQTDGLRKRTIRIREPAPTRLGSAGAIQPTSLGIDQATAGIRRPIVSCGCESSVTPHRHWATWPTRENAEVAPL
jgi:hypothetical protein